MSGKNKVYSSKVKYSGLFDFKEFYQFSYEWLTNELDLDVAEEEYSEKIKGSSKEISFKWKGTKKVTDYFKFEVKVEVKIIPLLDVELNEDGKKIKTNKGDPEVAVSGTLVSDYDGKFETSARMKLWRSIYEKWIIPNQVKQMENKLAGDCDEFLAQVKAFLSLSGKR